MQNNLDSDSQPQEKYVHAATFLPLKGWRYYSISIDDIKSAKTGKTKPWDGGLCSEDILTSQN
jgi:hypothetical protein